MSLNADTPLPTAYWQVFVLISSVERVRKSLTSASSSSAPPLRKLCLNNKQHRTEANKEPQSDTGLSSAARILFAPQRLCQCLFNGTFGMSRTIAGVLGGHGER